ncbi:efflux transporter outer membrane subunit [Roseateles oligotrophus]|uniref:Efflux transporter outer membrane subunit n=1 Tax=Roseateles oligotrophus TaxID=1769250 RepID=A0ABT2YIH1_9BURK|nr:efflux transporter outer membrane subunit [Roseateles oligotrophus]MCV2369854.1 efflux transporter outer membrane subunit [Roseateles oligotrophus]
MNRPSFLPITLIAAASTLLLSACMSLAPEHKTPAAPLAASWNHASADGQSAADLPWQSFYAADARLSELIAIALKNNRDLRMALLNVEQARALARVADANRLPTIGAGLSANRQPKTDGSGGSSNSYQAGLQISAFELDLFGRVKSQSDAALARYLASAEGSRSAQISLVAGVASSYLALQADHELLALARQTAAAREDSLRLTKLKFDGGAGSALDLSGAESAAAAARASLAQAKRQREQSENGLVLLLGQPLPANLAGGQPLAAARVFELPAGLPSAVLIKRPDVLQAEQLLIAANANIGAARAAFFPSISLTTSLGTASNELSQLFSNTVWSLGAQALMPIFDAGRNQANLEASKAAQAIAVAQYEKTVQQAFREVADALAGRATYAEQVRAQAEQTRAEAERLRLVGLRFANGASNSLELLDAQRASYAAQQALLQTRLGLLLNNVQLYKALGGGVGKG